MRVIPEVGDIVLVGSFEFTNKVGGTSSSNSCDGPHEAFERVAMAVVTHTHEDEETGLVLHGYAVGKRTAMYMQENANPEDQRMLMSGFRVLKVEGRD